MDTLQRLFEQLKRFFDMPLYTSGGASLTLWSLLYVTLMLVLLFYLTGKIKKWMVEQLLARSHVDIGIRQATGSIVRFFIVAIGFVIILQTAGIDLSTVTILAGALGIGVGFGLQAITSNLVSGLVLLFQRPIMVGDRIEVGTISGDVVNIAALSTTVVTNDNIAIIVPNSEFISSKVTNWSYTTRDVRFNFPVPVSHKSDPDVVRRLLLEVAESHPGVLRERKPDVLLSEFRDSSLNFILRVWTRDYTTRPGVLRSELNFAISRAFKANGVEIPFPQRDVHIRGGFPPVKPASGQ